LKNAVEKWNRYEAVMCLEKGGC